MDVYVSQFGRVSLRKCLSVSEKGYEVMSSDGIGTETVFKDCALFGQKTFVAKGDAVQDAIRFIGGREEYLYGELEDAARRRVELVKQLAKERVEVG